MSHDHGTVSGIKDHRPHLCTPPHCTGAQPMGAICPRGPDCLGGNNGDPTWGAPARARDPRDLSDIPLVKLQAMLEERLIAIRAGKTVQGNPSMEGIRREIALSWRRCDAPTKRDGASAPVSSARGWADERRGRGE